MGEPAQVRTGAGHFAPVTLEMWNRLLDACRAFPGNLTRAAAAAGMSRSTAKNLWHYGKQREEWGKVPIKDIIANEAVVAAARQTDRQKALAAMTRPTLGEAEAARDEAIEVRRQELAMIETARAASLAGLSAYARLASANLSLAAHVETKVREEMAAGKLDAAGAAALMCSTTLAGQRVMTIAERGFALQRRYGGDPTRPGVPGESADEPRIVTAEDAARALENAAVIAERMKNLNLRVITGGMVGNAEPENEPEPAPPPAEPPAPEGT